MPEAITAQRTAGIITFVRRNIGDIAYKKYPSNEQFYSIGNSIIEEIAEAKKNIKEDIQINLSPNKYYYDEADIIEQLEDVIRIDSIFLKYSDNTESMPLILVSQQRYEQERKTLISDPTFAKYPELAFRFDANIKRYYYIDENYGLYYWKPVTASDVRMIIKCSRNAVAGEEMNDENNPKLSKSWDKFVRAGILKEVCATSIDPILRNLTKYWTTEFEKYRAKGINKTKEMPLKEYKEF